METPESRRRTGRLIHEARKNHQLSQRGLAREAGISETWLRALTVGLRGEDPQRAADDTWIALAEAVHIPPRTVFTELGRPWPEDEGRGGGGGGDEFVAETTTHEGRLLEIVRDLEDDTDDLPDDVAEEIIRRSVEHMAAQARLVVEAERGRWERHRNTTENGQEN